MTLLRNFAAYALFALFLQAALVQAAIVDRSPRPVPRPSRAMQATFIAPSTTGLRRVDPSAPGAAVSRRPVPRPGSRRIAPGGPAPAAIPAPPTSSGVERSVRPAPRPARAARPAGAGAGAQDTGRSRQPRRGPVCRDRGIRGETLRPIAGVRSECGVRHPVRVTEVDGVALSQPSVMNCDAARALKRWVSDGVRPVIGRLGGGIGSLRVAGHYSCPAQDTGAGSQLPGHGKGNAMDISAFVLENGTVIAVGRGWRDRVQGNLLRRIHAAGCGPFGTVLGPAAGRRHQDHFHLDVARNRGGNDCR